MLPGSFYSVARHRAQFHLQAQVVSVDTGVRTPGFALVAATVERVFRGGNAIRKGDHVQFKVGVTQPGDEIPAGGVIWKSYRGLREAACIEAFLDGTPPELEVALSQCELLSEPTSRPVMRGSYPLLAFQHRINEMLAKRARPHD